MNSFVLKFYICVNKLIIVLFIIKKNYIKLVLKTFKLNKKYHLFLKRGASKCQHARQSKSMWFAMYFSARKNRKRVL